MSCRSRRSSSERARLGGALCAGGRPAGAAAPAAAHAARCPACQPAPRFDAGPPTATHDPSPTTRSGRFPEDCGSERSALVLRQALPWRRQYRVLLERCLKEQQRRWRTSVVQLLQSAFIAALIGGALRGRCMVARTVVWGCAAGEVHGCACSSVYHCKAMGCGLGRVAGAGAPRGRTCSRADAARAGAAMQGPRHAPDACAAALPPSAACPRPQACSTRSAPRRPACPSACPSSSSAASTRRVLRSCSRRGAGAPAGGRPRPAGRERGGAGAAPSAVPVLASLGPAAERLSPCAGRVWRAGRDQLVPSGARAEPAGARGGHVSAGRGWPRLGPGPTGCRQLGPGRWPRLGALHCRSAAGRRVSGTFVRPIRSRSNLFNSGTRLRPTFWPRPRRRRACTSCPPCSSPPSPTG